MKFTNTFVATVAVALLSTGCVKPTQDTQQQVVYDNTQPIYQETAPVIYDTTGTSSSGVIYSELPADNTVVNPNGTVYPQTTTQTVYTNPYETGAATPYPDPYATGAATTYPAQAPITQYPDVTAQAGGIHLQVAALKDYYAAEEFKNKLVLNPGQSAYVQRGAMNKVIITGIASMQEAAVLKNSTYPGAFIVQGAGGGYTPPVTPAYDPNAYTVNDSYGTASTSSTTANNGIGVQIGAFSSRSKAQEVADSRSGQYTAIVKKIGQYYKVILTGFANRSAAKAHASRVGGFVVSTY